VLKSGCVTSSTTKRPEDSVKIIVATTFVPFDSGGDAVMMNDLTEMLRRYGHEVDTVRIPFWSLAADMPAQMLAVRLLDIAQDADRLITIRTPSYLLRHPNKVVWFIHHHRPAYDLWGTRYQDPPNTPEGLRLREALIHADQVSLAEATQIYTNSRVVSDRLQDFNAIGSKVLYPPLRDPSRYWCADYGDYFFFPSRIVRHKRQHLALEAMLDVTSPVRLIIAGSSPDGEESERLRSRIRQYGLEKRVELIDRWITDEHKAELFAHALGCIYIPQDEDSYGYVTLESFHSNKPVVTCTDSGGTLELVQDSVNGFVVPPEPRDIASAMDKLMSDKPYARRLGEAGIGRIRELNISWDHVIRQLTG
jgi:glycosyltransferase involved in cell wall biosynthesis